MEMKSSRGQYLENLNILLFIVNLLRMKMPQHQNLVSAIYWLTIKKLKMKKFQVKPMSCEYFEQQEDKKAFALVSINSLFALSAMSCSWLKIYKENVQVMAQEKASVEKHEIWKIVMPSVPSHSDESDEIKNKNDECEDNYFLIQCFATPEILDDFVLYVCDDTFYNLKNFLKFDWCDERKMVSVDVDALEPGFCPELASSAVLAPIVSAFGFEADDLTTILNEYFATPKYLRKNDIFSINLIKYGLHLTYSALYHGVNEIFFKVIDLKGEGKKECNKGYYLIKGYSNLYLNSPIINNLLPRYSKYCNSMEMAIYPDGLTKCCENFKERFSIFLKNNKTAGKSIFLLSGVAGAGRKTILFALCRTLGLNVIMLDCFDLYGVGTPIVEAKFEIIMSKINNLGPCLLILKNVELIGRDREHGEDIRLINVFETFISKMFERRRDYPTFIVATTELKSCEMIPNISRLFVQKMSFEIPKTNEAHSILSWIIADFGLTCSAQETNKVVEKTGGYCFADLHLLVRHAIRFQREKGENCLSGNHFETGIEMMESAYSDKIGAARVPSVKWEDIGGLGNIKQEVMMTLKLPLKHSQLISSGLKRSGILFYGPPGTGKTLMAKAVATECNYNFLSVKGPELMNMYVGQSEKNIREAFDRARCASPCIIFFDELDSLAPNRGKSGDSGGVADRVVSQLLAEMDGLSKNKDVFVIAATNRPDLVDPALLRPGRFDRMFYVGISEEKSAKLSILEALTKKFILGVDVELENLVEKLPKQVTGADIYSICSNAWLSAAGRAIQTIEKGVAVSLPLQVNLGDFKEALSSFVPSLTSQDIIYYQSLKSLER